MLLLSFSDRSYFLAVDRADGLGVNWQLKGFAPDPPFLRTTCPYEGQINPCGLSAGKYPLADPVFDRLFREYPIRQGRRGRLAK
jgi:hypothetical protein